MLPNDLRENRGSPRSNAKSVLHFLENQLENDGSSAQRAFVVLFEALCGRVFGQILGKDGNFRHESDGWLSIENQRSWVGPTSSRPNTALGNTTASATFNLNNDIVVRLLGGSLGIYTLNDTNPPATIVEAISKESRKTRRSEHEFKLHALPKPIQDAWLALFESSLRGSPPGDVCTENDSVLLGNLLRRRPFDQKKLGNQGTAQNGNLMFQPLGLSPRVQHHHHPPSLISQRGSPKQAEAEPTVLLSMLEYYLFVFFRFPLYPPDKHALPQSVSSVSGVFIHRNLNASHIPTTKKETVGNEAYVHIFRRLLRHFIPLDLSTAFVRDSESESLLFLRTLVAFWMESGTRLTPTAKMVDIIRQRHSRPVALDLNQSYELVKPLRQPYTAPPRLVLQCVNVLVAHALLHSTPRDALGMSSVIATLQQPFFNFVRCNLQFSAIHTQSGSFRSVLNTWLQWLEPWKRKEQRVKNKQNNGKYTPVWEPFVAANTFVFVVPLAIFIRRARELDFSANFENSMKTVEGVFRVFNPQVVEVLKKSLESGSPETDHHKRVLGAFAPTEAITLSSLESDLRLLFEEISRQHLKKEAKGWSNTIMGSQSRIGKMADDARKIAGLPIGEELWTAEGGAMRSRLPPQELTHWQAPLADRAPDGTLTDLGRQQIFQGTAQLNPTFRYVGDMMRRAPSSYESQFVVDTLVGLSDSLNSFCGFDKSGTGGFRFNLRFFADYRNNFAVVVASFVVYIVLLLFKYLTWGTKV